MRHKHGILIGILILSAATDFLDGKIARKFHMVSEWGKLLNPAADKVTQGILLWYLFPKYAASKYVFLLFSLKETYMIAAGAKAVIREQKNDGAKWYGKLSTTVFYGIMVALFIFPEIPASVGNLLVACCGFFMTTALFLYAIEYKTHREITPEESSHGCS